MDSLVGVQDALISNTGKPIPGKRTMKSAEQSFTRHSKKNSTRNMRVCARKLRSATQNLPAPSFVDLDAADYDRWLAREITRETLLRPSDSRSDPVVVDDREESDIKRARRAGPDGSSLMGRPDGSSPMGRSGLRPVDRDCSFDESSRRYVPADEFRSRILLRPDLPDNHPDQRTPVDHADRDWRYPPSDYRHHRALSGEEDDDDPDTAELNAKRSRNFALMVNALVGAGFDASTAKGFCAAITSQLSQATFVELYGRGAIVKEANGPRRSLTVKG